jgi:hypothetical protein
VAIAANEPKFYRVLVEALGAQRGPSGVRAGRRRAPGCVRAAIRPHPGAVVGLAARPGEHTEEALRDWGFTPAEITDLETSRAVAQLPVASDHQVLAGHGRRDDRQGSGKLKLNILSSI